MDHHKEHIMSSEASTQNHQHYLDPSTLEALGSMQIRARALADGIIAGLHRSPHKGGSVEFAEYKEYSPGQDIRHIDWKVFAKSDRLVVKQFEDETNLRIYLLMDGSGSMDYISEDAPITKLRYSAFLASTLAYLFLRQGDAVGALSFDEDVKQYLPASTRSSHLEDLFFMFDQLQSSKKTNMNSALRTIAERAKPRSLLILFSDMLDANDEILNFISVLRSRKFEVALFHIMDQAELDLPFEGLTQFEGLEGEDGLLVDPDDLRVQYQELMQQHIRTISAACERGDVEYVRCTTNEPIEETALKFLRGRL